MLVLIHILIAITTLILSLVSAIFPTRIKLGSAYALILLTLTSGILVGIINHSSMLKLCGEGLIFASMCTVALYIGDKKLTAVHERINGK